MTIYKKPAFEDDSYAFVIDLQNDKLREISLFEIDYYTAKFEAFTKKDISKKNFTDYVNRPSFRNFDLVDALRGTIYTHTCEAKNKFDYEHILKIVKANYKTSRRCAVNFADTLFDYMRDYFDTSCLNSIHYYKDNVTLYFRASDIENELLIDLHLIYEFFIKPVGSFKTLTVFSSTAQNVNCKLENLLS